MPLQQGTSREAISSNIRALRHAGYPQDEAVRIAMETAYGPKGKGGRGKGEALAIWAERIGDPKVGVKVPIVPQTTNYTCGPAALRAALLALGVDASEDDLAVLAGTTAAGGTSVEGLADAAIEHGLDAVIVRDMTVDELIERMAEGFVVLTCIQATNRDPNVSYADEYGLSHWVVPCVVRDDGNGTVIECMDPGEDTIRAAIGVDDFEARWHGIDMNEPVNGLALVLSGEQPANTEVILTATKPL